jgi:hypothetical protein
MQQLHGSMRLFAELLTPIPQKGELGTTGRCNILMPATTSSVALHADTQPANWRAMAEH